MRQSCLVVIAEAMRLTAIFCRDEMHCVADENQAVRVLIPTKNHMLSIVVQVVVNKKKTTTGTT